MNRCGVRLTRRRPGCAQPSKPSGKKAAPQSASRRGKGKVRANQEVSQGVAFVARLTWRRSQDDAFDSGEEEAKYL